jgi:transcription elongation factor Elf1
MTTFNCPYCGNSRSKKVKYTSWKSVATHSVRCAEYTGEYIINLDKGPIHYSYFIDKKSDELKAEFGVSKYRDMLDKFRLSGFIKPDNSKKYTKEQCIEAIQYKAKLLGKTPTNEHFRKTGGKYPCIQYIVEMFGSWNAALTESGFALHHKSELYGVPTVGLDGHQYRSKSEAFFSDRYLYDKFNYVIEPKYPVEYHKWYDWYIPELSIYIELDGGIRPEVINEKIEINKLLMRKCLFIPTYTIKSPSRNTLEDFMEFEINETLRT